MKKLLEIEFLCFGFQSLLLATLISRRHVFAVSSKNFYHFFGQVCLLLCLGKLFIDRIQLFMLPNAFILLFLLSPVAEPTLFVLKVLRENNGEIGDFDATPHFETLRSYLGEGLRR